MNTIICLTTDIDEKDLSYFEEALEGELYDVFLTDKYGLKNALKENKYSDEIIVLCENDIDFVLRTRREGDYITPLGMFGTQKLKKYYFSTK